jgi:hypothetical protein
MELSPLPSFPAGSQAGGEGSNIFPSPQVRAIASRQMLSIEAEGE